MAVAACLQFGLCGGFSAFVKDALRVRYLCRWCSTCALLMV